MSPEPSKFSNSPSYIYHYIALALMLLLGLGLRFWNLDSKSLWLDEVLTALFTMGRTAQDVPLNRFFSLPALDALFTYQPGLSCAEITRRVTTESVHPPVFFCLLYSWLGGLNSLGWLRPDNWLWAMRALPALFGVAAIAAVYWLNRVAYSPRAGLLAAALMAVSPFAVYLSQEARHYTLPMLLITLALSALVQMQQDILRQKRLRLPIWLGWGLLNLLGLYTHYFCILALIAQVTAFTLWMLKRAAWRDWIAWGMTIAVLILGYLPWLPTVISHFSRPETDWLIPYKPDWLDRLEPLYQTLAGWMLMVIALPVEGQPDWIAITSSGFGIGFVGWLVWQLWRRWPELTISPATCLIAGFTGCIVLQFFAIVYLLDKDLTTVPRYNFIYYPGVCALLGASLGASFGASSSRVSSFKTPFKTPVLALVLVGIVSSVFVVQGLVFQKSYHPDRVAQNMAFEADRPLAVVMTYRSPQEVALGLSFASELQKLDSQINSPIRFAFVDRARGYDTAWRTLSQLDQPLTPPLNLWVVASPGMRTNNYPERLTLNAPPSPMHRPKMRCQVDPSQLYRQGFPYQLFRCQPLPRN